MNDSNHLTDVSHMYDFEILAFEVGGIIGQRVKVRTKGASEPNHETRISHPLG